VRNRSKPLAERRQDEGSNRVPIGAFLQALCLEWLRALDLRGRATTIICSFGGSWPDAHPSHLASAGLRHTGYWGAAQMDGLGCLHGSARESRGAPSILGGTDYTLFWPLAM
jgi:hypothetical protein